MFVQRIMYNTKLSNRNVDCLKMYSLTVSLSLQNTRQRRTILKQLRLVRFFDEEQGREFAFLTNATHISFSLVAELYKNRWQIELFFKWLKQHLKIKKFWGTT